MCRFCNDADNSALTCADCGVPVCADAPTHGEYVRRLAFDSNGRPCCDRCAHQSDVREAEALGFIVSASIDGVNPLDPFTLQPPEVHL